MIAIILAVGFVAGRTLQTPEPEQILAGVNRTYQSLDAYMDWGSITFSYRSAAGERPGETRFFNTGFKRPNRIRYEFVEPAAEPAREKRFITWSAFRGGYATWTNWAPRDVDRTTLQKSLGKCWGISESCGLPLKLLVPWAVSGERATAIHNTSVLLTDVSGHPAWRIDGVLADGAQTSIWIDVRSQLVVRYRHAVDSRLDGKPTNEIYTVVFHPLSNPRLPDSALRFIPPEDRTPARRRRHKKHHHRRS